MSEELTPLPKPDTHCFDDEEQKDVWSYSADQMQAYALENRRAQPAPSITERQSKWGRLYTAANALIVAIGFHGRLDTDSHEVESLQDKLHDLDSGEWMPGLMPAQSEPSAPADAAPSVAPEPPRRGPDGYSITGIADLRDAKWLDPECADFGVCQSLKFKAACPPRAPMTDEQIMAAYHKFGTGRFDGFEAAVRELEQAHGIGGKA